MSQQQPWLLSSATHCPQEWAEMEKCLRALTTAPKDATIDDVMALYEDYLRASTNLRQAWAAKQQQQASAR